MNNTTLKRNLRAKEIAQAALRLFARKGYAAGSIEEISVEAGIGKSTVYEYYRNKEELFVAAVMEGAEQWFTDLEAINRETTDPVERLYRIAALYVEEQGTEFTVRSKLFFEVLSQTLLQDGVFFHQRHLILNLYQRHVRTVVDFLLEGVSSGQLRPEIASYSEKIAINFLAYLDGLAMHSMVAGDQIDLRTQIDLFLKYMVPLLKTDRSEAA
jgi:AcrR family transcriptional regulator